MRERFTYRDATNLKTNVQCTQYKELTIKSRDPLLTYISKKKTLNYSTYPIRTHEFKFILS